MRHRTQRVWPGLAALLLALALLTLAAVWCEWQTYEIERRVLETVPGQTGGNILGAGNRPGP